MADEKAKGGAAATAAKEGEKGEDAPKAAKKPLNKKFIIIGAILLADLAIMAGLGFFIVSRLKGAPDPSIKAAEEQAEREKQKKAEVTKIGRVLPKPLNYTVNIGGQGEASHYLKCAIQLEWEGEEAEGGGEGEGGGLDPLGKEIEKRMPKISDIIINILSSQSYAELMRPSGKQKIKEAIVTEVNAILPDGEGEGKGKGKGHESELHGKVRNAFFTEFLVQ